MKKNELKSGIIVEYRKGYKRLVVNDNLIGEDTYTSLSNFNDDLKHKTYNGFDIIKIYNYRFAGNFSQLLEDVNLNLIWERKEIKLTDREIEILKALKVLGYEFLARDENTDMYAYNGKPYKGSYRSYWVLDDDGSVKVNGDTFNFIKGTEKEPTSIDDLLKGENKNDN